MTATHHNCAPWRVRTSHDVGDRVYCTCTECLVSLSCSHESAPHDNPEFRCICERCCTARQSAAVDVLDHQGGRCSCSRCVRIDRLLSTKPDFYRAAVEASKRAISSPPRPPPSMSVHVSDCTCAACVARRPSKCSCANHTPLLAVEVDDKNKVTRTVLKPAPCGLCPLTTSPKLETLVDVPLERFECKCAGGEKFVHWPCFTAMARDHWSTCASRRNSGRSGCKCVELATVPCPQCDKLIPVRCEPCAPMDVAIAVRDWFCTTSDGLMVLLIAYVTAAVFWTVTTMFFPVLGDTANDAMEGGVAVVTYLFLAAFHRYVVPRITTGPMDWLFVLFTAASVAVRLGATVGMFSLQWSSVRYAFVLAMHYDLVRLQYAYVLDVVTRRLGRMHVK